MPVVKKKDRIPMRKLISGYENQFAEIQEAIELSGEKITFSRFVLQAALDKARRIRKYRVHGI